MNYPDLQKDTTTYILISNDVLNLLYQAFSTLPQNNINKRQRQPDTKHQKSERQTSLYDHKTLSEFLGARSRHMHEILMRLILSAP